jgi:hypothetical protein
MGKFLRIDGFIRGADGSRSHTARAGLAVRERAILSQGSRVNFLYMGSMFRFAKMVSNTVLCSVAQRERPSHDLRKRNHLTAGCSDA